MLGRLSFRSAGMCEVFQDDTRGLSVGRVTRRGLDYGTVDGTCKAILPKQRSSVGVRNTQHYNIARHSTAQHSQSIT